MPNYKKAANRQDERVSRMTGCRIRPNSGAIRGHKGDLGGPDLFLETKTRDSKHDYLYIKHDWLDKCRDQAFAMGKPIYLLVVSAGDNSDYAVIDHMVLLRNFPINELELVAADEMTKAVGSVRPTIDAIDIAIARKRRLELAPIYKIISDDSYWNLDILYLEDFINYYNRIRPK